MTYIPISKRKKESDISSGYTPVVRRKLSPVTQIVGPQTRKMSSADLLRPPAQVSPVIQAVGPESVFQSRIARDVKFANRIIDIFSKSDEVKESTKKQITEAQKKYPYSPSSAVALLFTQGIANVLKGISTKHELNKIKDEYQQQVKKEQPERFWELKTQWARISGEPEKNIEKGWSKVGASPIEQFAFTGVEIGAPIIGGVGFVTPQQASQLISKASKLKITRADLFDIDRGILKAGNAKYDFWAGLDNKTKSGLVKVMQNKKIPLNTKISNYLKDILDDILKPSVKPTKPLKITGKEKAIVPVTKGVIPKVVAKATPAISKALQSLAEEARKYKSAEEFVENLNFMKEGKVPSQDKSRLINVANGKEKISTETITLLRGERGRTLDKMKSGGLWFTESRVEALAYGDNVRVSNIKLGKSKVFDDGYDALKFFRKKEITNTEEMKGQHWLESNLKKLAEKEGYDSLILKYGSVGDGAGQTPQVVVYNPKNINDLSQSQLTDFYNQATKEVKPVVRKSIPPTKPPAEMKQIAGESEVIKSLTTPLKDVVGEGFVAREVKGRILSPEVRVRREIAKYQKEIADKKLTEPLMARINKTKTRKDKVRVVRDFFGLTDSDIKSISRRDVGLMSDLEFKRYMDRIRVKAEDYALKRQIEIENVEAGYKKGAKLVKPEDVPTTEMSGFNNFIDVSKIKRKDIPYKKMDIAELMRDDKTFPAIRQSGFYANKDIQTSPINNIYKQLLAPYHMALAQDGYKLGEGFGTMYKKVWLPTEKAIVADKKFNVKNVKIIKDLGKKYNIKASKTNLVHLSDVIEEKIKATPNETKYLEELRVILDDLRKEANVVRKMMGKKEIGYIQNYIPHIQKTTLWNELLSNKATISDSLDFIVPNQVTNPFAYERLLKDMPNAERNLYVLLDRYIGAIGKDIYITPAIENIKAYNGVLKNRELTNAAKYWDEYIRTGLIGKQHKIDTALNIGQKPRRGLQKWNNMVNLAFLTGKLAWNVATQPLSYIMNVPMETGLIKPITSIFKSFGKPLRQYVKENSNVLAIKSSDVRAVAIGEGRNIQNRIYQTKINKYNNFISMVGSIVERELTLTSYIAGLDKAKSLGYTGKDALQFADLTAARTQSMYNKENRALILNSDIARTVFPFQSFSIEMFNHIKEIIPKADGAMKLKIRQRLGKLMGLIVGIYLANTFSKIVTGRKKTTIGTFIPFLGNYVDMLIASAMGRSYYGNRSPITVVQIGQDIIGGAKDFVEHGNIKKLRKTVVNFGLALGGIGGGSQLNNIIDGLSAIIDEDVKNVSGDVMFEVEDTISKIIAPIFGVWATKEGREYWLPKEEKKSSSKDSRYGGKSRYEGTSYKGKSRY